MTTLELTGLWLFLFAFGCFLAAAVGMTAEAGFFMAVLGATLGILVPPLMEL